MDAKANNQVRTLNEVTNNQTAFDRFCELTQRGYYIYVELKSKLKEKASLWITVSKENEEKEEIHLLVNQEVLNIVIVYLETGKLDDTSKINPNDLESFNGRGIEFKRELLQTEKGKGRKVIWAYNLMEKVASIRYNHGTIIFHPYSYPVRETNSRKNFVDEDDNKEKRSYPIVQSWLLEDKASYKNGENKEVIDTDFNSNYSLHSFSPSCTFAATKREETPLVNNSIININTLNKMGTTNFAPVNENVIEVQTSSVEQSKSENVRKTKRRTNGLQPSKGDMYKFVSHTWNPIKGECLHECGYCRMSKLVKNHRPIRLEDKELKDDLGSSNFIFVGSNTDMFAGNVPSGWINQVLDYCDQFDNKYLFQSKNPERFIEFMEHPVFKKSVICTTIESNIDYKDCKAPTVEHRITAIEMIKSELDIDVYLSIEPIMDFDINEMVDLIKRCNPVQVYIGADSKSTGLTEPTKKKTEELIAELLHFTTVKENRNLKRLMKDAGTLEVEEAKNTASTSLVMKIQVMQETGTGYEIKEENRRFGLIKENRPIKDSDVNVFFANNP